MRSPRLALHVLLLAGSVVAQSRPSRVPALVDRYCAECHTGADAEGGFELAALVAANAGATRSERIATAVQRVRSRTMPSEDGEQPSATERGELAAALAALEPVDPEARVATLRRLTRTEYERTVRDLTGVVWDGKNVLPEDARAYGFDTVGDVMNLTPLLFEKYFDAATTIATAMLAKPELAARAFDTTRPLASTLEPFLARAFRRPVGEDEVAERARLFAGVAARDGEGAARHAVLRSVFAAPSFLFRVERGRADAPWRLSPHELATRLSYALTGTLPDATLVAAADRGALDDPSALAAQARRLVAANGGRALADGFAAQAFRFRDVLTASADFRAYPQIWNGKLRPSFYEEAARLFVELVTTDASILTLLDCDHTWLDKTLAKHYGFGKVAGDAFERVPAPDRRRGGLLGMGAMLMVAAYPTRTSPVLRGRWILDQILDAPTPPPPANVSALPEPAKAGTAESVRARLERHRKDRACAACHAQIDPLGFALENFDVLGIWRADDHGAPIDARATLPDGTELDGVIALKDALLARAPDFARALARKLLVYAVGRPLVAADEPELARIVAAVVAGEYRFSALLTAVVTSPLFTMRDPGGPR